MSAYIRFGSSAAEKEAGTLATAGVRALVLGGRKVATELSSVGGRLVSLPVLSSCFVAGTLVWVPVEDSPGLGDVQSEAVALAWLDFGVGRADVAAWAALGVGLGGVAVIRALERRRRESPVGNDAVQPILMGLNRPRGMTS